jgi:hypothetical protein
MTDMVLFGLVVSLACCFMTGPGLYVVAFEAADAPPSTAEEETRPAVREEGYYDFKSTNGDFGSSGNEYSSEYYYPYDSNNDFGGPGYESGTLFRHCLSNSAI